MSEEIGTLRIKNGRCQKLMDIKRHLNDKGAEVFETTLVWMDFERYFVNARGVIINGEWRRLIDLLDAEYVTSLPEDEVEVKKFIR